MAGDGGLTGPEEDEGEAVADGSAEEGFGGFQEVATGVGLAVDEGVECSGGERDGHVEGKAVQVGQAEQTSQRSGDAGGSWRAGGEVRIGNKGEAVWELTDCSLRGRVPGCW